MRRLILLLLPLSLACSLSSPQTKTPPTTERPPSYAGLGLENLDAYRASFEMQFEGAYDWSYQLETRSDGSLVAYYLQIEGVDASRDPGDVRAVVEGNTVKMRGPGTENACVQFPTDLDLGPIFLMPDDIIDPEGFQDPMSSTGTETVAGVATTHYTLRQAALDDWRDAEIDLWIDGTTGATLRYSLHAAGQDPLFDAAAGTLSGEFLVHEVAPQTIEPIAGCEIDLPLPADATGLVRLPGLVAFDSTAKPEEAASFYEAALPEAGWEALAEPETGQGAIVLSYGRGGETLEVNIERIERGTHIELLLE